MMMLMAEDATAVLGGGRGLGAAGGQSGEAEVGGGPRLRACIGTAHVNTAGLPPSGLCRLSCSAWLYSCELISRLVPRTLMECVKFRHQISDESLVGQSVLSTAHKQLKWLARLAWAGAGRGAGERRLRDPCAHRHRAVRRLPSKWSPRRVLLHNYICASFSGPFSHKIAADPLTEDTAPCRGRASFLFNLSRLMVITRRAGRLYVRLCCRLLEILSCRQARD